MPGSTPCDKGSDQPINHNAKHAIPKRSLKTKQHTTPDKLVESHSPTPANHTNTPHTAKPLGPQTISCLAIIHTPRHMLTNWSDSCGGCYTGPESCAMVNPIHTPCLHTCTHPLNLNKTQTIKPALCNQCGLPMNYFNAKNNMPMQPPDDQGANTRTNAGPKHRANR